MRAWWSGDAISPEDIAGGDLDPSIPRRIHILGLGNIGTFVAHSLGEIPNRPPVTLLLHTTELYQAWKENGRRVSLLKNGLPQPRKGYDINVLKGDTWYSLPDGVDKEQKLSDKMENEDDIEGTDRGEDDERIDHLVLTVKAGRTVTALDSIKHRLTPDSTILFLQNGLGVLEEVNEKVFPDPKTRPNYLVGITSHGLYRLESFSIVHVGIGVTILGSLPQMKQKNGTQNALKSDNWAPSSRYLLHTLTRAPALTAVAFDSTNVLQHRLEKLAINAVINPLTAIFDCRNGELLYNYNYSRVMRLLLIEISAVICAMPELQGVPGVQARFSPERLRTMTVNVASRTSENPSSTLQDVRAGKQTEIEYINGYIVQKGEELGIRCALNYMIMQMVIGKGKATLKKFSGDIPMDLTGLMDFDGR